MATAHLRLSSLPLLPTQSLLHCKLGTKTRSLASNPARSHSQTASASFPIMGPVRFTMKFLSQAVPLVASLMLVLLASSSSVAAVTCGDVIQKISPCLGYLRGSHGTPPPPCSAGVKALAASCTTTADRQAACGCLKAASRSMKVNPAAAKALPEHCGISLDFSIDPNIDCSMII